MSAPHAVVVGGTRGLGLVVVERFLARGYGVTVISRSPSSRHAGDTNVRHLAADLEHAESYDGIWSRARDGFGPISYLVLCQRFRGIGDLWDGELRVGLTASKRLIEGFANHFAESGDRAIGVVSSVYAQYVGSSQPVGYHVVKAGLNEMVRYYAATLGRRGIRVNAIMPLTYLKEESRQFYEGNAGLMDLYRKLVPLQRMGTAEDSVNALSFLCSEQASFINGQSLLIDGGVSVIWPEEVAKSFAGIKS
ncbi:MAG TPA: SDR family oxidoreductase [Bradyrhizobium sp.]|uniref:SDR family NAD(P)-dependent oxidoreductase n=1 Tax=Bradyrhizobium sp. TaxID=376 RepID=UPI002D049AF3|nr:SDR family oxidoreductase [Bradyrhizobium sp.]HLZ01408.1 SDR family oxidoreductase [Bradyrhizobium sp.]